MPTVTTSAIVPRTRVDVHGSPEDSREDPRGLSAELSVVLWVVLSVAPVVGVWAGSVFGG